MGEGGSRLGGTCAEAVNAFVYASYPAPQGRGAKFTIDSRYEGCSRCSDEGGSWWIAQGACPHVGEGLCQAYGMPGALGPMSGEGVSCQPIPRLRG